MPVKVNTGADSVGRKKNIPQDDDYDDMSTPFEKYFNPNYSAEFMGKLPERIRQRAEVLLYHHEECEKLRKNFEEKEMELRRKYDEVYAPLHELRKKIVSGTHEPTDEEVAKGFPSEHADKVDIGSAAKVADGDASAAVKGLPGFWLRVLRHHVLSSSLIEEHDEEVLSHLTDIRSGAVEGGYGSFAVVFVFEPNDFFEEETLMLGLVQSDDGEKIIRSSLTWKPGKDVTVTKVTKKLAGKRGRPAKVKTVTVPRESFFNMFKEDRSGSKGAKNDDGDDEDDDEDEDDEDDEEQIGQLLQVLHASIVPCAVEYYTGEAPDGSSDMESDDDDYDDDDDEEEEEEEEEEPVRKGRKAPSSGGNTNDPKKQPKECKQQ